MAFEGKLSAETPDKSVVSVLVADIVDSTSIVTSMDAEDSESFLNECFQHVKILVEKHGGILVHFSGDGAIALFGWPNAFEAHADFACLAAKDIVDSHFEYEIKKDAYTNQVQFRVGVHSGSTIVRKIQTAGGKRLDAVGATVHTAAALQKSAMKNSAVISAETKELCRLPLETTSRNSSFARQDGNAIIYQLDSISQNNQKVMPREASRPLFGRNQELEIIKNSFPNLSQVKQSLCLIGEPGIGKTSLLRASWKIAEEKNLKRVIVFCNPLMRARPYFILTELFHRLNNADVKTSLNEFLDGLCLDDEDLKIVQKVIAPDDANPIHITQRRTSLALIKALDAAISASPILICLEDIHMIDGESQRIFSEWRVASHNAPCLLLMSSRPEGQSFAYQMAAEILHVKALDHDTMVEFAKSLLPESDTHSTKISDLIHRADGVPFILEQLARSIGTYPNTSFDPLPLSVESAIHSQITKLTKEARKILQTLSVIGNDYATEFVCELFEYDVSIFLKAISELENYGFIEQTNHGALRFCHDILLDACIRTLHRDKRIQTHDLVYETLSKPELIDSSPAIVLAFHAKEAGELKQSLGHYWDAALEALRTDAAKSLDEIFDQALLVIEEIGPSAEKQYVDFVLMAVDPLQQIGNVHKINKFLPRAVDLARQQKRPDKECLGLSHMALICWFEGRSAEGLPLSERAFTLAKQLKFLPLLYYSQFQLAVTEYSLGNVKRGVKLQSEMKEILSGELRSARLGASVIPGSITRSFLAYKQTDIADFDAAERNALEAMEIAKECEQPYSMAMASLAKGRLCNAMGRYSDAEEVLRDGYELVLKQGLYPAYGGIVAEFGTSLLRLGKLEEGLQVTQNCFQSKYLMLGSIYNTCFVYMSYYDALRAHGNLEEANKTLNKGIEIVRNASDPLALSRLLSAPARIDSFTQTESAISPQYLKEAKAIAQKYNFILHYPFG